MLTSLRRTVRWRFSRLPTGTVDPLPSSPSATPGALAHSGRRRFHVGRTRAIAAACAVCLVAGLVLLRLDAAERLASSRELELSHLAGLIETVSAEQWQAVAESQVDPALLATFHHDWGTANAALAALRSQAPTDPRLAGIVIGFQAYISNVDQALAFLQSGAREDAEQFERTSVATSLQGLEAVLAKAGAAYASDARQSAADKQTYSLLALAVASGLLITLLWLVRRSQILAERRFRSLIHHSKDVFSILEMDGRILYESPAVEELLGYAAADRIGSNALALVDPVDAPSTRARLEQVLRDPGASTALEFGYQHADGTWRRLEAVAKNLVLDPAIGGIAVTYRDVTDRRALEEQLRRQALEDPLTGLSNRALLKDRLDHAVERSRRAADGRRVAVFFLDLDEFKTVNDGLGHAGGDSLLVAVGQRIQSALRAVDTVARYGGDEFAVLAEDIETEHDADVLGRRILSSFSPPFQMGDDEVVIGASLGYAIGDSTDDGAIILRNADLAMYQAKADGKGRLRRYDPALHESVVARLALDRDLRRALEAGEFRLHYQPIVDLGTSEIVGVEALVRWAHPERGLLAPDQFIVAAEATGLIVELGRWVLTEACQQLASWDAAGGIPAWISMSVNVSARQLQDPRFADDVAAALQATGLDGRRLTLELTETILVDDSDIVVQRLTAVRALGVRIAIDDFGTGFSSLGYLRRFPIDVLKIDRTFIRGMNVNAADLAVVEAAIGLAETLGLETVAEGIEQPDQSSHLRDLGAEHGQGFLFAHPLEPEAAAELFRGALGPGQTKRTADAGRRTPSTPSARRAPRAPRRTSPPPHSGVAPLAADPLT